MYEFNKPEYEDPGLGDMKVDDPYKGLKMATAKWVGEKLQQHYAGWAWMVRVEIAKGGGLVLISLPHIMGPNHHYACQLNDVMHDPGGKNTILKGAGELLERYNLPRTGFSEADWMAAMNGGVNLVPLK